MTLTVRTRGNIWCDYLAHVALVVVVAVLPWNWVRVVIVALLATSNLAALHFRDAANDYINKLRGEKGEDGR